MYKTLVAGLVGTIVSAFPLAMSCTGAEREPSPKRYSSPIEVFNRYREAREKGQWRAVFSLPTPEGQKDALFEAYFMCGMHEFEEQRAILRKYGLDEALDESLKSEYKAKHGDYPDDNAQLDKFLNVEYSPGALKSEAVESRDGFVYLPRSVLCNIIAAHVKDKAGFFEAVAKLPHRPICPLGDLEQLVVQDDKASAHAKLTFIATPGESPPVNPTQDTKVRFRRIDGGWFLESL